MTDFVEIFEVGPRDGLQNEKRLIKADDKIALVNLLSDVGYQRIEVTSFVSPKWVPQMGDGAEVLAGIRRDPKVSYAALTPNLRGFEGAVMAKADEVAIFASASEGFSRANINCSIAESLERFHPVLDGAKAAGIPVRGYVSCVVDCPFDGKTSPGAVADVVGALAETGCYEISLGDTLGRAQPAEITTMLGAVLTVVSADKLAGHYHATGGHALENIDASLELGIRVFDASVGGLGGCPYAPGAAGNVATEDVVAFLTKQGLATRLDRDLLDRASEFAKGLVG